MTDTDPTTTSPATALLHDLRETIEERRATGQAQGQNRQHPTEADASHTKSPEPKNESIKKSARIQSRYANCGAKT